MSRAVVLLKRGAVVVLVCAALGGIPPLIYSLLMPSVYEARTSVIVFDTSGDTTGRGVPVAVANVRALLENRGLAQQVIKEYNIEGVTPDQFVLEVLRVDRVRDTNQLQVFIRLGDPQKAASVANRLVALGSQLSRTLSSQEVVTTRELLKTQMDEAGRRMNDLQTQLGRLKGTSQVELLRRDTDVMLDLRGELLRLNTDIEAERARLASAQQELARHTQSGAATPSSAGMLAWSQRRQEQEGTTTSRTPSSAPATPESSAAASSARATPRPSSVEEMPPVLDAAANPVRAVIDYEVSTSRSRLASLEKRRDELTTRRQVDGARYDKLARLYDVDLEIGRLQLEYDLAKEAYAGTSKRYEQTRVMELGLTSNLHVADSATVPTIPVAPRTKMNVAVGMALGLACGMAWALRGLTAPVSPGV
ncbi:MAG: GumC family protein [Vicinamibacterales bacterium]